MNSQKYLLVKVDSPAILTDVGGLRDGESPDPQATLSMGWKLVKSTP
jgi:hypothetical protein